MLASIDHMVVFSKLAEKVAENPQLLEQLEYSFIPEERAHLVSALQDLLPQESHAIIKDVFSGLLTHCRQVELCFLHGLHC